MDTYAFAEWNLYLGFLNSFIHMLQLLGDRQSGVTWYALSKEILISCSQNASVKRGEFGSSWHVYSGLTEYQRTSRPMKQRGSQNLLLPLVAKIIGPLRRCKRDARSLASACVAQALFDKYHDFPTSAGASQMSISGFLRHVHTISSMCWEPLPL